MRSTTNYVTKLKVIYNGEPFFGESLKSRLTSLTEQQALKQPKPGEHSIAELISHMDYWRRSLIHSITGDSSVSFSGDDPENWPDLNTLKERSWKKILHDFHTTQELLVKTLERHPTLPDPVMETLEGTLEHDIYHMGQIGIVKKMVS